MTKSDTRKWSSEIRRKFDYSMLGILILLNAAVLLIPVVILGSLLFGSFSFEDAFMGILIWVALFRSDLRQRTFRDIGVRIRCRHEPKYHYAHNEVSRGYSSFKVVDGKLQTNVREPLVATPPVHSPKAERKYQYDWILTLLLKRLPRSLAQACLNPLLTVLDTAFVALVVIPITLVLHSFGPSLGASLVLSIPAYVVLRFLFVRRTYPTNAQSRRYRWQQRAKDYGTGPFRAWLWDHITMTPREWKWYHVPRSRRTVEPDEDEFDSNSKPLHGTTLG